MFTGLKNQLELSDSLIDDILLQDNELIKLKKALNWKAINKIYKECFPSRRGRGSKKTDIALGLLILKHLYKKSDRDLVRDLHLNTSYMHFCSLSYDEVAATNKSGYQVIDSSTLTRIRARLGAGNLEKINTAVTSDLIAKKIIDGKQEIESASLAVNDMADAVLETTAARFKKLAGTGAAIISQIEAKLEGKPAAKRILSYHEQDVVSLPKSRPGKARCAFGAKLSLSVSRNGYITDHGLYDKNIADIDTLGQVLKKHSSAFGKKFKAASTDRAYYDKDLIEELERQYRITLAIPHKKRKDFVVSRRKKLLYTKRAAIEAKISEGKRACDLSKSYYKGFTGDRMWTSLSVLALNLRQLLKDLARKPQLMYKFG